MVHAKALARLLRMTASRRTSPVQTPTTLVAPSILAVPDEPAAYLAVLLLLLIFILTPRDGDLALLQFDVDVLRVEAWGVSLEGEGLVRLNNVLQEVIRGVVGAQDRGRCVRLLVKQLRSWLHTRCSCMCTGSSMHVTTFSDLLAPFHRFQPYSLTCACMTCLHCLHEDVDMAKSDAVKGLPSIPGQGSVSCTHCTCMHAAAVAAGLLCKYSPYRWLEPESWACSL